ncbi:MAG: hypothetical protein Pyrs2KO_27100 [Pyruvatibacter sp.]
MAIELEGVFGEGVKIGGLELVASIAAQHVPVQAVEQKDDDVLCLGTVQTRVSPYRSCCTNLKGGRVR